MIKENKLELSFDYFHKNYSEGEIPFLKRWKKGYFSSKILTLEDIEESMQSIQKQKYPSDSYEVLEKIKERNGNMIYTFRVVPGHESDAIKYNYPISYIQRKVVPRIKLRDKK